MSQMSPAVLCVGVDCSDEEAVAQVLAGNTAAFELLMRRYNERLYRAARAITRDYHDDVRVGLNIASGAVLVIALGTVVVGLVIFLPRLLALLAVAEVGA